MYLKVTLITTILGNQISFLLPEHLKGLGNSLEKLILAENSITHLPSDAFLGLRRLTTINLRGNHLRQIDPNVFRDGMDKLVHLILADNQLRFIPYQAISPLKALRTLDLSYNLIKQVQPSNEIAGMELLTEKMRLEVLRLDYNQIDILVSGSFQNFAVVNQTYLDGNILISIEVSLFGNGFRLFKY